MSNSTKALKQAATLTFESLGFMLVDPEPSEEQQQAEAEARVTVDFQGPFGGKLEVRMYGGLLPLLAANMLGELDPPGKQLQHDALGELANVICGNALPAIAGVTEVFHLEAPVVEPLANNGAHAAEAVSAQASLGLDNGRADVLLFMDQASD